MDEKLVETVARGMCREDHPCWSIVGEIMGQPDYPAGHEGDAAYLTQAGRHRRNARAVIPIVLEEAAKVADSADNQSNGPTKSFVARSIAARIRAMGGEE